MMLRYTALILWRALALASVALALIGLLLPGLPTVPFLILAAWAAGKGWPRFEAWLLAHPRFGPTIRNWRAYRSVPRRAKWAATVMMLVSLGVLLLSPVSIYVKCAVPVVLVAVASWLWMRPER